MMKTLILNGLALTKRCNSDWYGGSVFETYTYFSTSKKTKFDCIGFSIFINFSKANAPSLYPLKTWENLLYLQDTKLYHTRQKNLNVYKKIIG